MHDAVLQLEGDVLVSNVMSVRRRIEKDIKNNKTLSIDFSHSKQCDSSALALLVACQRFAKQNGTKLYFRHLPDSLIAIAKVCNLRSMTEM
jgi:ABC-type transporter Mla MlaB component